MIDGIEYKEILKNLPFGYALHKVELDHNGVPIDYEYIDINEAFEKITGLKRKNVIGKKITEIFPNIRNDKVDWIKYYGNIAMNSSENEFEQYSEELKKWYKIKVYSPKKYYFITYFTDINEQIQERELFRSTILYISEGIIAADLDGNIIIMNKTAERLTGYLKNEVSSLKIFDIFDVYNSDIQTKFTEKILDSIYKGEIIAEKENVVLKSKNGIDIPIVYSICPVKNNMQEIYEIVISFRDITDKIAKDKELDYITYHDSLTGVYNRNFFNEEIKKIDIEENLPISVIMGDVNGLKLTNDAFGHLMGDKLLLSAANIMKRVCRENDIVVRWGGG